MKRFLGVLCLALGVPLAAEAVSAPSEPALSCDVVTTCTEDCHKPELVTELRHRARLRLEQFDGIWRFGPHRALRFRDINALSEAVRQGLPPDIDRVLIGGTEGSRTAAYIVRRVGTREGRTWILPERRMLLCAPGARLS